MPKHYPTAEEKRAHLKGRMDHLVSMWGSGVLVRTHANNMAAGPCAACLELAKKKHLADTVALMPLDSCPHPDQCVGVYQMVLD